MPSYDPQVEWFAALNGQTPQDYITTLGTGVRPPTPQQAFVNQGLGDIAGQGVGGQIFGAQQTGDQWLGQLGVQTNAANQGLGLIYGDLGGIAAGSQQRAGDIAAANQGLSNTGWQSSWGANAADQQTLGQFGNAVGAAGAWDLQNYQNLANAANAPMQMTASPYVGDAQSNAADVARQTQVFGQLQGAANGSLNQTSQAAQAYANSGDIANQQRAAADLTAAGRGALDVDLSGIRELDSLRNPGSIAGMSDLLGVYKGSQDVKPGQLDPEAYAAQVDARNRLKGLSDPTVTAQERLMYELSKRQQEQDEASVRAAEATAAERRGMGGVGTSIARQGVAAQQTGQDRVLRDMAANAGAVNRSLQALQGYGTMSTAMAQQANDMGQNNANRRVGALGQYTGVAANAANVLGQIGANNATANMNRRAQAEQAAYAAYANLRAQGFSEAYARGQAADVMANANADRQLGAMGTSAQLASSMRNSGDAMSMFNQGQRQQQSQFADSFTAGRQDAQFGRANTLAVMGNNTSRNFMADQTGLANTGFGVNNAANQRVQDSIQTTKGLNQQWLDQSNQADSTGLQAANQRAGVINTQLGNNRTNAAANMGWSTQKVNDAITLRGIGLANSAPNSPFAQGVGTNPAKPLAPNGQPLSPYEDPNSTWYGQDPKGPGLGGGG